jgi:hypothetical protein
VDAVRLPKPRPNKLVLVWTLERENGGWRKESDGALGLGLGPLVSWSLGFVVSLYSVSHLFGCAYNLRVKIKNDPKCSIAVIQ